MNNKTSELLPMGSNTRSHTNVHLSGTRSAVRNMWV